MIHTPEFEYQPRHLCAVCQSESSSPFLCGFRMIRTNAPYYFPRRLA